MPLTQGIDRPKPRIAKDVPAGIEFRISRRWLWQGFPISAIAVACWTAFGMVVPGSALKNLLMVLLGWSLVGGILLAKWRVARRWRLVVTERGVVFGPAFFGNSDQLVAWHEVGAITTVRKLASLWLGTRSVLIDTTLKMPMLDAQVWGEAGGFGQQFKPDQPGFLYGKVRVPGLRVRDAERLVALLEERRAQMSQHDRTVDASEPSVPIGV